MFTIKINRFLFAGITLMISFCAFYPAFAQQTKPAANPTASSRKLPASPSPVKCTQKNMACCKGTISRAAVLASNAKTKPVIKN